MPKKVTITAKAEDRPENTPPLLDADTSPLRLRVRISGPSELPDSAELILTAHELFSRNTKVLTNPVTDLSEHLGTELHLNIKPEEFPLSPGLWHILVDVMCGEQSLAESDAGSTEVYVRPTDESPLFSTASYELGRAEYAFEREFGAYFTSYDDQLPATIDPFSDHDAADFQRLFVQDDALFPETVHDAGIGALLAAHAYRATGYRKRCHYCEEAIARFVRTLLKLMTDSEGQMHRLRGVQEERAREASGAPANAMALTFLSRVYFYFMQEPINNKDYARYVLEEAKPTFRLVLDRYQDSLESDADDAGDPRVLAGLSHYCLAHKAEHGQYFSPVAENALLKGATHAAENLSLPENKPPDGNELASVVHLLSGFLGTHCISCTLAERGDEKASATSQNISTATDRIRASLTATGPHQKPSTLQVPANLLGSLYSAVCWYGRLFRQPFCEDEFLACFQKQPRTNRTIHLGELNAAGAELHFTSEYRSNNKNAGTSLFFSRL